MIIGMDFGTTNSGLSVYDGEQLRLIPLDPANRNASVAPTALYITNDRAVHIGKDATNVYYEQNLNRPSKIEKVWVGEVQMTFAEVGTFYRDVYVDRDVYAPGRLFLSFKMGLSSPNYMGTIVGNQYFFLEDIIATYLYVTKVRAEQYLQREVDSIVFGRPVRYSDNPEHNEFAKERMIQAAFSAGYKTVYLEYEPIAAAYYYEMGIQEEQNVLIFDFGGGTLDLSIVNVGNKSSRRVIANGGIPIAGDVFDQRIVRNKYPKHFGEGTRYRSGNTMLDVPSSFYDAFGDWQTLLTMQSLDTMERLKQIENTSQQQFKIRALRNLITGQYGLKMFDVAEQAKRKLSDKRTARIDMTGEGFRVFDSITRREFEKLIRSDIRDIEARLDDVMQMAGLQNSDIDAVIRTGGSSQIPVFVEMLESRFGADKVRDIDAFGSVTSGLGVIGHQITQGDINMTAYHASDYEGQRTIGKENHGGVPTVDLDVIKQVIQVTESGESIEQGQAVLLMRDSENRLDAIYCDNDITELPLSPAEDSFAMGLQADEKVVLMTSDYVCYVKQASEIADLRKNNLYIEQLEGFRSDAFSNEIVYGVAHWQDIIDKDVVVVISSLGYTQKFFGDKLIEKMVHPVPYRIERKRGYPAFLVGADNQEDIIAVSHAGRVAKIKASQLPLRDKRLLSVPMKGNIVGMFAGDAESELLIATSSGYVKRVQVGNIPYVDKMNTNGEKIIQRANPVIAMPFDPKQVLFALTNQRIIEINPHDIPLDNDLKTDFLAVKTKRGEQLITLFTLPV